MEWRWKKTKQTPLMSVWVCRQLLIANFLCILCPPHPDPSTNSCLSDPRYQPTFSRRRRWRRLKWKQKWNVLCISRSPLCLSHHAFLFVVVVASFFNYKCDDDDTHQFYILKHKSCSSCCYHKSRMFFFFVFIFQVHIAKLYFRRRLVVTAHVPSAT